MFCGEFTSMCKTKQLNVSFSFFLQVPGGMKRRVLRWYDYSWSRGRIQGGGDINTALGLLPDKLKTELALHVNLSVLKKVSNFLRCFFSVIRTLETNTVN